MRCGVVLNCSPLEHFLFTQSVFQDGNAEFRVGITSTNCPNVTAISDCISESGSPYAIYIQTDKRVYKAGQRINLRVFALHTANLTAVYHLPFLIQIYVSADF